MSRVQLLKASLIVFLAVVFAVQSQAQTLSARNTGITFNLSGPTPGITDWTINGGGSLLNNQWFYYSVGNGPIYTIDNISAPSAPVIGGSSKSPTLSTSYANSSINVSTLFTLGSGLVGSPTATLGDAITISNPTGNSQVYHFYQYSFFAGGGQAATFTLGGVGYNLVETSLTPPTTVNAQMSSVSGGTSIFSSVQTGIYNGLQFGLMNGASAPTLNNTLTASGMQVDFAYEWDITLAPSGQTGSSLTISELQTVSVPEPASLVLVVSGMLAVSLMLLRRRNGKDLSQV